MRIHPVFLIYTFLVMGGLLPVTVKGQVPPASPSWTYESNAVTAHLGFSVAPAGDMNHDGYDDFLVGARYYSGGQLREGQLLLFYGSALGPGTMPNWSFESNSQWADLGWSVSSAGDVNGDGWLDVIAGAPYYTNGQNNEGRAYLFLGSPTGLGTAPDWVYESNCADCSLGIEVTGAGDLNGDGYDDVAMTAPFKSIPPYVGAVYVFYGSSTGLTASPSLLFSFDSYGATLEASVAGAGDVNGDGYDDLIAGAPSFYSAPLNAQGKVYVYLGSPSGISATASWTYVGAKNLGHFGSAVAGAGDVNGDGYDDIMVGEEGPFSAPVYGQAYLFLGSPTGPLSTPAWNAGPTGNGYVISVASAGDVNQDGFSDILFGAYNESHPENQEGRAYLYLGSPAGPSIASDWVVESNQTDAFFGVSVASAGDVNGDGLPDVLVGAPFWNGGQTEEGRAYLYLSVPDGTPTLTPDASPTLSPTCTATSTASPTPTRSPTPSFTWTTSVTSTWSPTPTPTVSATGSMTPTVSLTVSASPSRTASSTATATPTSTRTSTRTSTLTSTQSRTVTGTPTLSWTVTPTPSATMTITWTATSTCTPTRTQTPYRTGCDGMWVSRNAIYAGHHQVVKIKVGLCSPGRCNVRVYNAAGELTKILMETSSWPGGPSELEWDGLNNRGEKVSSGIYLIHLTGSVFAESRLVAVIR